MACWCRAFVAASVVVRLFAQGNTVLAEDGKRQLSTTLATNLALYQPVVLSSTLEFEDKDAGVTFYGSAQKATDGDTSNAFFMGGGCAETTSMPDPWARIDLGREVPVAVVRITTRTDSFDPGLGPIELYLGNVATTWRENLMCASNVQISRSVQPNAINCLASGRYLWIVLRARGSTVAPLSLCEVEVTPKGPTGTLHVLQTVGTMWGLTLTGLALSKDDRIRIVADTLMCGGKDSSLMDSTVLELTAPMGQRVRGDSKTESWENIQISKMGLYKVCWCGGQGGCRSDENFAFHVAMLNINGVMISVGGKDIDPNITVKAVSGIPAKQANLEGPYGLAVSNSSVFVGEQAGHRVRWLDLESGMMWILCGQPTFGKGGDGGMAKNAELSTPKGIALDSNYRYLYIADSGNNKIRRIDISGSDPSAGMITTVAGNGFRGYSGNGGSAVAAQLNSPTGVAVDLNNMLWICDYGNSVVRVVSMTIPVRIPGTNEFQVNIILAAAGNGQDGLSGSRGDGGMGRMAQVPNPVGIAVSSAFLSREEGSLPVSVYASEAGLGNTVRSLSLDYQSYLGVINTVVGNTGYGDKLEEAMPGTAKEALLSGPSGIAVDAGNIYVSDTGNNRILMMPSLEYVSLGCWRENIDAPWIPSIEGKPQSFGNDYLTGPPENREDAVTMCALAALQRGFEVFAVRQMGVCAGSADARLYYRYEGTSTSCADGKGGSRDNSVYKFARSGMMEQLQGLVFILAGREGRAGFTGDMSTAWTAEMNKPTGLAISPTKKDLWIADTGNNRLRLIFSQIGPDAGHEANCFNGNNCIVQLRGNGLQPGNRLGIFPLTYKCGQAGMQFLLGLGANPVSEQPSHSFTMKSHLFGVPEVTSAGTFRLCYCLQGSIIFSQVSTCDNPEDFIHDAGQVNINGVDSLGDDQALNVMPGTAFDLPIFGRKMSQNDRVSIVDISQKCGSQGTANTTTDVLNPANVTLVRDLGNETAALWADVIMKTSGAYRVCWCRGMNEENLQILCDRHEAYNVKAMTIIVRGPVLYNATMTMGEHEQELTIRGSEPARFGAGNRIRIVDHDVECGSFNASEFSDTLDKSGIMPAGPPQRITSSSVTWTGLKIRTSKPLRVCWCGDVAGCVSGADFAIDSVRVTPIGPQTHPPHLVQVLNKTNFTLTIHGTGFTGRERVSLVDDYTKCSTLFSATKSPEVTSKNPSGTADNFTQMQLRWNSVTIQRNGRYRLCYCACINDAADCCELGQEYIVDVGSVYVGLNASGFKGVELVIPNYMGESKVVVPPPNHFGLIPQDVLKTVTIRASTMPHPAHAGSMGNITVRVFQNAEHGISFFPWLFKLTDLPTGSVQNFSQVVSIPHAMRPAGIEVRSMSMDAWYCDYIELEIEGFGSHRFACTSWTASPASERTARNIVTMMLSQAPEFPKQLPPPSVDLWESRLFHILGCGGCPSGFTCMEELAPMNERLRREQEVRSLGRGFEHRPSRYRAACRPICGDGYAQRGEQCDDGNLRNLDGCSADCKVENGFECSNSLESPSFCYQRLCDNTEGTSFPTYGAAEYARADELGYTCSVNTAMELKAPPATPLVCYPWSPKLCPANKSGGVHGFVYSPPDPATVACKSYRVKKEGGGLECNATENWEPELGEDRYLSYDACAHECLMDKNCSAVKFFINTNLGGEACAGGLTPRECQAKCRLLRECTDLRPFDSSMNRTRTVSPDQYYVGRKISKTLAELPVHHICSEVQPPKPVFAFEQGGMVVVQMDSAVEQPLGVALGQTFKCTEVLTAASEVAVGGPGSSCRWADSNVLQIVIGPYATLGRPAGFDSLGWLSGEAGVLAFDQSKLKPRGTPQDCWATEALTELPVAVRKQSPYAQQGGGMVDMPLVILRAPATLGGCGRLEVSADISAMGNGRRWRHAKWTCLETRPDASLDLRQQTRLYDACKYIQLSLDAKSWCGDAPLAPIARSCEMRAIIESSEWCGLVSVRLGLVLTSVDGLMGSAEWTTEILPKSRIPTAAAVGVTEVHMSPQRIQGQPIPRLRLEVSTESDAEMIGFCTCNLTAPPLEDGTESRVLVSWYYGEIIGDIVPQLFSMTKVTNDESFSANILVLKMEGELMKPNAIWRFVARVSYAVHDEQQATQVPFTVRILPFQAPKAVAVGPSRINNDLCSFVIDARPSQLMEILYYSSNRRLDAGNAPEARLLQESIVMTTTRPLSEAKEQKLEFRWKVTQLAVGVDHAAEYTVVPASSMINEIAAQRTPELKISEAMLKEGLYVFTVFVSDAAIPGLESQASATVQIFRTEQPALTVIGPVGVLGPMDSATAKFQQIGFGMCPVPSASMDGPNPRASILLLRAPIGSPRRQLRAVAEVTIVISKKDMMGGNGNSLLMEGTAPPELLMPGYVYAYRLLLAEKDYASDLATFRTALIRAGIGDDAAPLQAAQRELAHEPTSIPSGIQVLDTDVFSIHSGPMAGTLDTMEPILRIGFAMQDLFRFQQIWVTDNPPLEFAYYYSEVPKDRAAAFQAELSNFFPDIGTDNRILDLVPPGSLVPLSDWSHDPTLATPLAEGMYVFEGRVRDAKGVESRKYAVVESVQAWQEEVVTSQDRLTLLDRYLKTSRQAILQVRALNRGAVSVVPVTAAVYGLPPLSEFNFKAMLDWNSSSTEPAPNRSQPIYGAPIVSRETRAEVVRYLHDIMSIFSDIVSALDAESLGAKPKVETRRLQDTNASLSNVTTPSHVEALSSAFSILASNIAPVLEPSLFVELGRLTADMLQRIRDARGDIRKAGNSPTELMTTISYLLAQTQPINKPREGVIVYNATEDVQARLSVEIVRATMLLGDVLGAITPVTAPPAQIRVAMPVGDYLNYKGGGDFVLTVASKTLNSIISEGVSTDPDYQSMERWMFPRIGITGLGAPGFMAQNWAGGADSPTPEYKESKCFGETEAFLERVQVLTVSWPINPFMYATGSLVGMNANVTLPYTVQLRSCGLPLVLSEQAGKVVLTFRLDPATVRDRRWGYADTIPYRVAWWEDIPGVGSQAERIRRWTTHGCKTEWVKSQEDMVQARCDRLPGITAGSVFVVELVPRPKYEVAPIPKANKNIHNVITYLMILFILRWTFLLVCAIHGDTKFWLTEKQNIKLLFLPAEFAWQDKARRGRLPLQEQAVYNPFSGAYWRQAGYVMKQRTLGLYCGYKALKGNELFYSAEVKELVGMRGGDRDGTYEHFVDSMNDKENAEKVSFAKEQRRGLQIAMAQMALPAPDDGFAGRRAAWPEAAALADSEGRWRSKSAGTERGMSDHGKGSKTSGGGSLRAASIGSGRHQAEAIQEVSGSNPVIGQGQTNQEAMTDAALQAAIFEGKVGQIPSDWEEYVSAEHGGRVFYVNGVTGVSSWEKPVLMADGSTQFEAESGEMINQPGRDPSKELPPLRGTSQKFGSLGRAVKAQRTLTAAPPEIEQAPNPSRSLKPDAMHRAAPPEDDEDDEDERTAVERESEVPAHRRLPLLRTEAVHRAPMPPDMFGHLNLYGLSSEDAPDSVREGVEASLAAAANSQETVLPVGWELHTNQEGREFFVNLRCAISQWEAPALPPHWEERASREGQVYYLSVFDGRTQWEWPQEHAQTSESRLAITLPPRATLAGMTPQGMAMMLTMPGSLQPPADQDEDDDPQLDVRSDDSTDIDVEGDPADQVDALQLLAVPPGGAGADEGDDEVLGAREEDKPIEKWGEDKLDKQWADVKAMMHTHKVAHDVRWETAKQLPGVREFVRPYELTSQTNNWDRQLDNVTLKMANIERQHKSLGVRAELKKEELRGIFPVIQRLQWTKWDSWEILCHCIVRALPVQNVFLNIVRPGKTHRCLLHIMATTFTLLGCCTIVAAQATVSEDIVAENRSTWELAIEALTMPVGGGVTFSAGVGWGVGKLAKTTCRRLFFAYEVPQNQPVTQSSEARRYQLRYWHELAEMGKWTCAASSAMAIGAALSICALSPQPRAAGVLQAFFLSLLIGQLVMPLLKALGAWHILTGARNKGSFDGVLTIWPGIMDFVSVGVKSPEFLAWRVQRIVSEHMLLNQVFPSIPNIAKKARNSDEFTEVHEEPRDEGTMALQDDD